MNSTGMEGFENDRETTLSLPIKKSDLGNFITDLLGQPQSIERVVDERFDIDFSWFINLHELIDQRINQQNHADLASFNLIVYFDNGLKRTLTSIDAMKSYNETKSDIPIGVKIVWSYLVHFPGKPYPEKQQISFSAFRHRNKKEEGEKGIIERLILSRYGSASERSSIRFQIDHTERTWGDDIEVVISNHIDEIVRKNSFANSIFELSRVVLAFLIFAFGFFYSFFSSITERLDDIKALGSRYAELSVAKDLDLGLVNRKLDVIAQISELTASRDENIGILFLYMIASSAVAVVLLELTQRQTRSYIVLSRRSEEYRANGLKKEKRSVQILFGSFFLSVAASILANYWYELMK